MKWNRIVHPTAAEYTFSSSAYRTFSKIDHFLGLKTSLNKFREIEVIPISFPITKLWNWKSIIGGQWENSQICGN